MPFPSVSSPPSSGGSSPLLSGHVIGPYYTAYAGAAGWGTGTGSDALNDLVCVPVWLETGTLDRLAQQHFGSGAASELYRMGLYADNGSGKPSTLLVDGGTIDLSTAAAIKSVTINQAVTKGLYWLAGVRQGGKTTSLLMANTNIAGRMVAPYNLGSGNLYDQGYGWMQASVTGALPNPFTASTLAATSTASIFPFYRYSA